MKRFTTNDLFEAAAIHSVGVKFLGTKREKGIVWFEFENAEEAASKHWAGELKVKTLDYSNSIRNLKDLIFSKK